MTKPDPTRKQKTAAILNLIAGGLFLAAAFNPLGSTPGPIWLWLAFAALYIGMGVWGLLR